MSKILEDILHDANESIFALERAKQAAIEAFVDDRKTIFRNMDAWDLIAYVSKRQSADADRVIQRRNLGIRS